MWPCERLGPSLTSAHPASPPAHRRWVLVKEGLGTAAQDMASPRPRKSLDLPTYMRWSCLGEQLPGTRAALQPQGGSSDLSLFVGVLLPPPHCPCTSH